MAKKGLGRGLEHLLEQNKVDTNENANVTIINIDELKANPYQPRKKFNKEALLELSESIKEQGVIQPILVRRGLIGYEIIAGERRFRASKLANITEIPAIIYDYDDEKMMEVSIIENIQREDLTIVEEAKSYKVMMENLNLTQEKIGEKVGKSRSHIANITRLLNLDDSILDLLDDKKITMGHVKVLISIDDKKVIKGIIDRILNEELSVRKVEEVAKEIKKPNSKVKISKKTSTASPHSYNEKILREFFGVKVEIVGTEKGKVEIPFSSANDLGRILELLIQQND